MSGQPALRALFVGPLLWALTIIIHAEATVAAAPPSLTIVFLTGKAPEGPACPRTIIRTLRHETIRRARGRLVDVTRWRPTGAGADVVVTVTVGPRRIVVRIAPRSDKGRAALPRDHAAYGAVSPPELVARAEQAAAYVARSLTGDARPVAPRKLLPETALKLFEKALALGAADKTDALIQKRSLLSKAVSAAPKWALARLELGETIGAQGDAKGAVPPLSKACELSPDDPEARAELALAYRRAGRYADAVSSYSRALALAPRDPVTHNNFGVALLLARQPAGAVKHFEQAVEIEPLYHEPLINLGTHYRFIGEEHKAEEHYRRAVALAPKAPGPRITLAKLLTESGRHRAAERQLESAVADNPEHAAARLEYAVVLARRQKYSPAIKHLERVLEIAPEYREAWYNLGLCHHYMGRDDKAIEVFETGIRREPDHAPLYYGLGLAYEAKKERRLAEEALKMALEKDPKLLPAELALKRVRGEFAPRELAWPFGLLCPARKGGRAGASCLPSAITLAALFLPALALRRRSRSRFR